MRARTARAQPGCGRRLRASDQCHLRPRRPAWHQGNSWHSSAAGSSLISLNISLTRSVCSASAAARERGLCGTYKCCKQYRPNATVASSLCTSAGCKGGLPLAPLSQRGGQPLGRWTSGWQKWRLRASRQLSLHPRPPTTSVSTAWKLLPRLRRSPRQQRCARQGRTVSGLCSLLEVVQLLQVGCPRSCTHQPPWGLVTALQGWAQASTHRGPR